jgi:hypothetical protein
VNHQKIGTLVETIYGAHLNAISVLALDAIFANNERHTEPSFIPMRRILAVRYFENWSGFIVKLLFQLIDPVQCRFGTEGIRIQ